MRMLVHGLWLLVTGCAAIAPAPVRDTPAPTRIEAAKPTALVTATGAAAVDGHVVKKGDTLYSIALDHGVDVRDLTTWNGLDNPNRIRLGQRLRVAPPDSGKPISVSDGAAEIRPISAAGEPQARPLDTAPATATAATVSAAVLPDAATAVSPAPTFSNDTEQLKRSPKGGKLPYSEDNLARLKAAEAQVAASPAVVVTGKAAVAAEVPVAVVPAAASPAASPATVPATVAATAGEIAWGWPLPGKPMSGFGEGSGGESNKGLDFAGKIGDPVVAAAPGKVIHVGSEIRGLGHFIVVKHTPEFLSVYANNSRVLVKQDQVVTRGQKIAELGQSDADQPKLHFEIRQQGKPVDPLKYLPPR